MCAHCGMRGAASIDAYVLHWLQDLDVRRGTTVPSWWAFWILIKYRSSRNFRSIAFLGARLGAQETCARAWVETLAPKAAQTPHMLTFVARCHSCVCKTANTVAPLLSCCFPGNVAGNATDKIAINEGHIVPQVTRFCSLSLF